MSGEEREKVKWRLELFEKYVLDVRDKLDANRERCGALAQSVEDVYTTWRNNILVVVSLVASIILGLSPSGLDILTKGQAVGSLLPTLGIGLTAFVLFYHTKSKIHDYILEMDASFFSGKNKVSLFRGYTLARILRRQATIDEKRIDFYYEFMGIVTGSVALELQYKFENMLKYKSVLRNKPFSKIRKELENVIKDMKWDVNASITKFQDRRNDWALYYKEDMTILGITFNDFFDYLSSQINPSEDEKMMK
jgi:hypothetical protein